MDIKDLQELEAQVRILQEKIQAMKVEAANTEHSAKQSIGEFEKIKQLAKRHPLKRDGLKEEEEIVQKDYFRGLMQIVLASEESVYEGLLYVARIAKGINSDISVEELYRLGKDNNIEDITNMYETLISVKYIFLTDALIVAQLYPKKKEVLLEMIADISGILGLDSEDMKIIMTMARAVITENWDILAARPFMDLLIDNGECIPNFWGVVPSVWLAEQRVSLKDDDTKYGVIFKIGEGQYYICHPLDYGDDIYPIVWKEGGLMTSHDLIID